MPLTSRLPQYRLILLPVDGSDAANYAALHVAALAPALGAAVAILAVMDTGGALAFTPAAAASYIGLRAAAQAAIEAASTIIRGANVALVEHLIMDGVPAVGIVETAAELDASVIVLGVAQRGADAAVLDPIAAMVVRDAPCPVLLVRASVGGPR